MEAIMKSLHKRSSLWFKGACQLCLALLLFFYSYLSTAEILYQAKWDDKEIWLLGTLHFMAGSEPVLSKRTKRLIMNSNQLWVELNEKDLAVGSQELFAKGLRSDQYLHEELEPELWDELAAIAARLGLAPSMLAKMEPWLVEILVQLRWLQDSFPNHQSVDQNVISFATSIGLEAKSLDRVSDQVQAFEQLSKKTSTQEKIQRLLEDLPNLIDEVQGYEEKWRHGELESLWLEVTQHMTEDELDILLYQRNKAWVRQIFTTFQENDQHFVAVGAAHLPGEQGLLALLRAQGATITFYRSD